MTLHVREIPSIRCSFLMFYLFSDNIFICWFKEYQIFICSVCYNFIYTIMDFVYFDVFIFKFIIFRCMFLFSNLLFFDVCFHYWPMIIFFCRMKMIDLSSIFYLLFVYVYLVSALFVNFLQLCSMVIWPFNKSLYRKINYYLVRSYWCRKFCFISQIKKTKIQKLFNLFLYNVSDSHIIIRYLLDLYLFDFCLH